VTEADLKSALVSMLRQSLPGWVIVRHEDTTRAGIPDISVTGCGWTSWWEVKHANPYLKRDLRQEKSLWEFANAGYARYIIYEGDFERRTIIAHPNVLFDHVNGRPMDGWKTAPLSFSGHDHRAITRHIATVHAAGSHRKAET
jgi:hypothetical protein